MLSFIILFVLALGYYVGARRGLILQGIYTTGYLVAFLCAFLFYRSLASKIELFVPYPSATEDSYFAFFTKEQGIELADSFYLAVAFLFVLFIGWCIVRLVGVYLQAYEFYPIDLRKRNIGGGVLGLIVNYLGLFFILYILGMIPIDGLQKMLEHSILAKIMIQYTPIFSHFVKSWWLI